MDGIVPVTLIVTWSRSSASGRCGGRRGQVPLEFWVRVAAVCTGAAALLLLGAAKVADPLAAAQSPATYEEQLRPQFHFSPAASFTNDPNGLVYYKGTYHLFYQQRVFAGSTGLSCCDWGHAVSRDLVHWEQRPVAIHRVAESGTTPAEAIFSGSAVVDWNNTSGFGSATNPPLVAIYTAARPGSQTQKLAYSVDEGTTWRLYAGNPVLDIQSGSFRDPKVFWYEPLRRWTMVIYSSTGTRFYTSLDLKSWEYQSTFATGFECPDFFPLAVDGDVGRLKWLLFEANGQYWVGDFDGSTFKAPGATPEGLMDYGTNYYAAQTFSDSPGRRVLISWISPGFARNGIWPELPWMGAMTVARELGLKTIDGRPQVVTTPVDELARLRTRGITVPRTTLFADTSLTLPPAAQGNQLDIEITIEPGSSAQSGLRILVGEGLYTTIGYDSASHEVFLDRSRSGRQDGLGGNGSTGRTALPQKSRGKPVTLRVLVDRSTLEVYADGGSRVLSATVLPLVNTTITETTSAGAKNIKVQRTQGFAIGQTLRVNMDANGPRSGMQEDVVIAEVGTGVINTALAAPLQPGEMNVKVTDASNFVAGRPVTIGSGETAETLTVAEGGVGTAASNATTLSLDVPAGSINIKVGSVAGLVPGGTISVGVGSASELATVGPGGVGTQGRNTTLAADTLRGESTVKVANVAGLAVGGWVVIGFGTADAETRTIAGPVGATGTFTGTAGSSGTGINLSAPLTAAHPAGAALRSLGTGVTLSSPLSRAHAAGVPVRSLGTGITLTRAVQQAHAAAVPVTDPGSGLTLSSALRTTWPAGTPLRTAPAVGVEVFATGGTSTIASARVWKMRSIWSDKPVRRVPSAQRP
jgi:fructan beta-fructosidase